jgi:HEPN superfamily AbiU2-like protein
MAEHQATAPSPDAAGGFEHDVKEFSAHCAYVRSVYILATRIWRDSDDKERALMEAISPSFFLDIGQVLAEYAVLSACRIADPANEGDKNENFTLEFFVNCFPPNSATFQQLDQLHQAMSKHRKKIKPARDKLVAHADRTAIRNGQPLGMATWQEWNEFWTALKDFVRLLNEKVLGTPFEIDVAGVSGDAEMLLKSLRQSHHFEKLLRSDNRTVQDACVNVAEAS